MIKIQIGDRDPWHLSPRPLILTGVGLAIFIVGAILFAISGVSWVQTALVTVGLACVAAGVAAMVREKRDMDAAIEAAENDTAGQM